MPLRSSSKVEVRLLPYVCPCTGYCLKEGRDNLFSRKGSCSPIRRYSCWPELCRETTPSFREGRSTGVLDISHEFLCMGTGKAQGKQQHPVLYLLLKLWESALLPSIKNRRKQSQTSLCCSVDNKSPCRARASGSMLAGEALRFNTDSGKILEHYRCHCTSANPKVQYSQWFSVECDSLTLLCFG